MRLSALFLFAFAVFASACGQTQAPPTETAATTTTAVSEPAILAPWMLCDALDAPSVFVATGAPQSGHGHLLQFNKANGAPIFDAGIAYGAGDGAAGSVYIPLIVNGADAGSIRVVNAQNFETPGAAYTQPITSVQFQGADAACRWLPRTRLAGFTSRRSFVVHEDDDGDLIYTTFDFADAARQTPIELSNNGRSTTFSVEVRGGEENITPEATTFRFEGRDGYAYRVTADASGQGRLEVLRNGAVTQTEPLIAFLVGQAGE